MFGNLMGSFDSSVFDEFRRLETEMDQLLGRWAAPVGIRAMRRGTFPPINVGVTPAQIDVYVFAAGLDPKGLDLSIQQNLLTISGSRKVPLNEAADYYRRERFDGDFRRVVTLPEDADPNRVNAKYHDGVLHIRVQRREAAQPRQIQVK